jgi:hypothetical protein
VELLISRRHVQRLTPLLGDLVGAEGAECPVPLSAFDATPAAGEPDGYSGFRVANFPRAAHLVWLVWVVFVGGTEFRQDVRVQRDGVVVLEFPKRQEEPARDQPGPTVP